MKESYGEGLANHTGPESCAGGREPTGEALTGEHAGQPLSSEITETGAPTLLTDGEGHTPGGAIRKSPGGPAESKTLRMRGRSMHGNREIPSLFAEDDAADRPEKAMSQTSGMHGDGKSDSRIVPKKRSNNGHGRLAETGEGRRLAKGNLRQDDQGRTQCRTALTDGLERVRKAARRDRRAKFTALLHHITPDLLERSFLALQRDAAPGVDGMTWREYEVHLRDRLDDLHARLQRGAYRALPSRRAYIPKADGRARPLGIAALEDKIVQRAVVEVLNCIYEVDFLGFSYGFRPERGAHDALDALWVGITEKKVNWVLDADIRSYFDTINHEWLIKFLEHRIADCRVLRLIAKWLRAGVLEDGRWWETQRGSPQGAVISPLLANVFLHYVFDLWVNQWRKVNARGDVIVVRYADDFVLGFQHRDEAERFLCELRERLANFGLTLHTDKTRLIEFGRFAASNRRQRCQGKPETFDFLGFTHISGLTSKGWFTVKRKTIAKRLRAKIQEIKAAVLHDRHLPLEDLARWLAGVVRGYFNYFAVPGNYRTLAGFRTDVIRHWFRALRRRSQKSSVTWNWFSSFVAARIPRPSIQHPFPNVRFHAKYPRQEPYAVIPPVRIRAGGAG